MLGRRAGGAEGRAAGPGTHGNFPQETCLGVAGCGGNDPRVQDPRPQGHIGHSACTQLTWWIGTIKSNVILYKVGRS